MENIAEQKSASRIGNKANSDTPFPIVEQSPKVRAQKTKESERQIYRERLLNLLEDLDTD